MAINISGSIETRDEVFIMVPPVISETVIHNQKGKGLNHQLCC